MEHVCMRDGKYIMLALDHRGSFAKYLNKEHPEEVTAPQLVEAKRLIIEGAATHVTGALVDMDWGLSALHAAAPTLPYVLPLEKTGYEVVGEDRRTILSYTPEDLLRAGASGAKLLLFMRPGSPDTESQVSVAEKAFFACEQVGLPLFLEIVVYGTEAVGEATLQSAKLLMERGIAPRVWKLAYPGTPELCDRYTNELNAPWILLSGGAPYEQFKAEVETAVAHGSIGFLVGRALWQDMFTLPEGEREVYAHTNIRDRMKELAALVS